MMPVQYSQMKSLKELRMDEAQNPHGPVKFLEVDGKIGTTYCPGNTQLSGSDTGAMYPCLIKIPVYDDASTASSKTTGKVLERKLDLKIEEMEAVTREAFLLVCKKLPRKEDLDSYMSNLKIAEKLSRDVQILQKDLDNLIDYSVTKGPGGGFIIYCDECAGNMIRRFNRAGGRAGTRKGDSAKN